MGCTSSTLRETALDEGRFGAYQPLRGPKAHHVFISYTANEMDPVFEALLSTLSAMDLNVFNQRRDLAGVEVNKAEMQAHAMGSKVVLPLLSPGYFDSEWCRAEVEAAAEAGVPIVPVYSGGSHTENQIKALLGLRSDPIKGAAVKACFKENLIDVHNPAHMNECISDLKVKVIHRFVSMAAPPGSSAVAQPSVALPSGANKGEGAQNSRSFNESSDKQSLEAAARGGSTRARAKLAKMSATRDPSIELDSVQVNVEMRRRPWWVRLDLVDFFSKKCGIPERESQAYAQMLQTSAVMGESQDLGWPQGIEEPTDPLHCQRISQALLEEHASGAGRGPVDKFRPDVPTFVFEGEEAYRSGILARVGGVLTRSMQEEFEQNEGGAWLREFQYVIEQPARAQYPSTKGPAPSEEMRYSYIRDLGHDGWTLDRFHQAQPPAGTGPGQLPEQLSLAEVRARARRVAGHCPLSLPLPHCPLASDSPDCLVRATDSNCPHVHGAVVRCDQLLPALPARGVLLRRGPVLHALQPAPHIPQGPSA